MRVGIKLSCLWRDSPDWAGYTNAGGDFYSHMLRLGIDGVEFSLWHRPTARIFSAAEEVERVRMEAQAAIAAGLTVHLHPYAHLDERGPGYFCGKSAKHVESHLQMALELAYWIAERQGQPISLVYHPAENPYPENYQRSDEAALRSLLGENSQRFFEHAGILAARHSDKIIVLAETQVPTSPTRLRIGDRPEELHTVIGGSPCKICWDSGHYAKSAEKFGFPLLPDAEFLRKVGHVHLHTVVDGRDHQPAHPDDPYLQQCVGLLRTHAYSGHITLEYNYVHNGNNSREAVDALLRDGIRTVKGC